VGQPFAVDALVWLFVEIDNFQRGTLPFLAAALVALAGIAALGGVFVINTRTREGDLMARCAPDWCGKKGVADTRSKNVDFRG
jgi:hypothetical protein